jgi:hypothetical protein
VRTFWAYTLARLAILLGAAGVLWVAGARGILLIVLAFFISMLVSYWALAGMREWLAAGVQARAERINDRIEAASRAEDDDAPAPHQE